MEEQKHLNNRRKNLSWEVVTKLIDPNFREEQKHLNNRRKNLSWEVVTKLIDPKIRIFFFFCMRKYVFYQINNLTMR